MNSCIYLCSGVVLAILLGCVETYHITDSSETENLDNVVGWLHGNCFAIKNPNISSGTKITLVLLDDTQKIANGTITNMAHSGEECYALLDDRGNVNTQSGYSFYLIASEATVNLGVGLADSTINAEKYVFDYCTTSEGVSYSMSRSVEMTYEKLWSGYYYLGYDSEPTCK